VDEIADWVPDRRLLEQPCRNLVQQRLKGVVVVLVDEDDVDLAVLQLVRGSDAAKAGAENEDAGALSIAVTCCAHGVVPR
jgi:hypothetical protein